MLATATLALTLPVGISTGYAVTPLFVTEAGDVPTMNWAYFIPACCSAAVTLAFVRSSNPSTPPSKSAEFDQESQPYLKRSTVYIYHSPNAPKITVLTVEGVFFQHEDSADEPQLPDHQLLPGRRRGLHQRHPHPPPEDDVLQGVRELVLWALRVITKHTQSCSRRTIFRANFFVPEPCFWPLAS